MFDVIVVFEMCDLVDLVCDFIVWMQWQMLQVIDLWFDDFDYFCGVG